MKEDLMHPSSEELFAYRDGELTPEKRAILEAHVSGCSICRALIDQVSALEAELRQAPTAAPPGYLDRLSESVRARVAAASSERADVEKAAAEPVDAEVAPRSPGRFKEGDGRGGRAARLERGRVKEAPKLPWAAVVGTASAAVAVLVVVVILIRQGPYQQMVTPTPQPKPQPVTEGTAGVEEKQEAKKELDQGGARDLRNENERKIAVSTEPAPAAKAPTPSDVAQAPSVPNEPMADGKLKQDANLKDQVANRADELAKRSRGQAPLGMASGDKAEGYREETGSVAQKQAEAPRAKSQVEGQVTEAGYQTILDRYGIPPIWNERVTPSALASAEPDLRSYYMSGAAGSDSARVRLYLAEATRLRYAPGDTELYDEIAHHYQRVIELAGTDTEAARVARERLRSLEK
ncbi:MAG TPA: zf-HC2 domain-containing protein [Candidatus Angelobacter sp.]|nr:zf-HC2 domain-containing protein [Candidatus Angelobacter sp.]